ncbi:Rieske (2Fe-2S) protein [Hymenobacter saemangeumensis]|uniref:Rieske (2Fe-2S) protein n=1 Tax=Hymenobacter saemangeumensis TaxID=1084522 RepID=A0ABP8IPC6_9BACT
MKRQEFLHLFGFGAAMVLSGCLGGCASKKEDPAPGPGPSPTNNSVDFTIDLNDPANARLNDPAFGYVYGADGRVIVAKTTSGSYIALSAACTHQGATVRFDTNTNGFTCPLHGSQFSSSGAATMGPASAPLRRYTVAQTGSVLRITS